MARGAGAPVGGPGAVASLGCASCASSRATEPRTVPSSQGTRGAGETKESLVFRLSTYWNTGNRKQRDGDTNDAHPAP